MLFELRYPRRSCRLLESVVQAAPGLGVHLLHADPRCHVVEGAVARDLAAPPYRLFRQLNKGESLHALRRDLCYAHEGKVRHRHHEDQTEQALCLTVVTNAIVAWTTEYLGLADKLGPGGMLFGKKLERCYASSPEAQPALQQSSAVAPPFRPFGNGGQRDHSRKGEPRWLPKWQAATAARLPYHPLHRGAVRLHQRR